MTTATIYAGTNDDSIVSGPATGYSTVRAGTGLSLQGSTATDMNAGQIAPGGGYYEIYQAGEDFDTSSIGSGKTVSSAVLSLYGDSGGTGNSRIFDAILYDWGTTVDTGDFRDGTALGSCTLLAHFDTTGGFPGSYNSFTDDAFPANVNVTGHTRILIVGRDDRNNTAPTGTDYVSYYSADQTGTTQDPKLVVTYAPAGAVLAATPVGASAVTAALTVKKPLVASLASTSAVTAALTVKKPLVASLASVSAVTAGLSGAAQLAAAPAGVSVVTATIHLGSQPLVASLTGASAVTAGVTVAKPLAAAPAGLSAVTANLSDAKMLVASAASVSAVTAGLTTGASVQAALASVSVVTANLHPGAAQFAASLTSASVVTALMSVPTPEGGLEVSVWIPDSNGIPQMTEILENAQASTTRKWLDIGAGQLTINSSDPKATNANLGDGVLVNIATNGVIRNGFFIESAQDTVVAPEGISKEDRVVAGRDYTAILENARVYPPGWPSPAIRAVAEPLYIPASDPPFPVYANFLQSSAYVSNTNVKVSVAPSLIANNSFETDTSGWSAFVSGVTQPPTSFAIAVDAAPNYGTNCGALILPATLHAGETYPIAGTFLSGITYAISVWLKSVSGTLNVRAGMASDGTPTDIAQTSGNITTSWARYTFTWTPSADRTDGEFFLRSNTASAATIHIDAVLVNRATGWYQIGPASNQTTDNTEVVYVTAFGDQGATGGGLDFTTEGSGLAYNHGASETITQVIGTALAANSSIGATNLKVISVDALAIGQWITAGLGSQYETRVLTAVGTAGSGGSGVTFATALVYAHTSGDWVIGVPSGTATGTKRSYTTQTFGYIFAHLIAEAKGRGGLPALSTTFTSAHDTTSTAWSTTVNLDISAGASLLDVWTTLVGLGLYTRFRFGSSGGAGTIYLDAYDVDPGTDRTALVVLRQGHHIRDVVTNSRQATDYLSRVLVEGANGSFVEVVSGSETVANRREGSLAFGNSDDPATLTAAGQDALNGASDATAAIPVPMFHGTGAGDYEPGDDFVTGDSIALDVPGSYSLAAFRVVGSTWATDPANTGLYTTEVDLNSTALDYEVRLKKQLDALAARSLVSSSIATGGVGSNAIADGSITPAKLSLDGYTMDSLTLNGTSAGALRLADAGGSGANPITLDATLTGTGNQTTWKFSDAPVWTPEGLIIPVATGGVFGPQVDGAITLDTTNHRLYWWENSANHYVARTAGFEAPKDADGVDETLCPRCGRPMLPGERTVGRWDSVKADGALHGVWEHMECPG